ncbi:MAG: molecular chaperone DnaJ, partial [Candidatus Komeilibacteria bacterium CG_4_9_14_0_8_um_filter_36_9]
MSKDYYQILGVDKKATKDEIKKAFRKKAHEHHPDKGNGNADKFKEINEAYQVLSNEQKRQQYYQYGSTGPFGYDGARA